MKYTIEDIERLKLPDKYLREFVDKVASAFSVSLRLDIKEYRGREGMAHILKVATLNDYKNRAGYLLGDSRDRAIAAYQGPTEGAEQKIMDIWLAVTDKMPELEKILAGWDKV